MGVAALDFVEQVDRFEKEGLAPLPIAKSFQPRAAENCPARPKPFADALDSRARTKGETAEVELCETK